MYEDYVFENKEIDITIKMGQDGVVQLADRHWRER